jgi:hypothetical protein
MNRCPFEPQRLNIAEKIAIRESFLNVQTLQALLAAKADLSGLHGTTERRPSQIIPHTGLPVLLRNLPLPWRARLGQSADFSLDLFCRARVRRRWKRRRPRDGAVDRLLHVAGMQAAGDDQLADAVDDSGPGLHALPVESRPVPPVFRRWRNRAARRKSRRGGSRGFRETGRRSWRRGFCARVCLCKPRRVRPVRRRPDPIRRIARRARQNFRAARCGRSWAPRSVGELPFGKRKSVRLNSVLSSPLSCTVVSPTCLTASRTWSAVSLTKTPTFSICCGKLWR